MGFPDRDEDVNSIQEARGLWNPCLVQTNLHALAEGLRFPENCNDDRHDLHILHSDPGELFLPHTLSSFHLSL